MPCDFDENLIQVTSYEVLGKLPNPFICDDGTVADTPEKWEQRRREMYKTVIELQYGTQPPAPEFLEVEKTYAAGKGRNNTYLLHTGTRENPITFGMRIFLPNCDGPWPVVVDGDGCFEYFCDKAFIEAFTSRGVALAIFNRTELAHDLNNEPRETAGQLYRTYPDKTFGALGAWAWGFSRCVDALEKIGGFDMSLIAFTGHSRGGKTAMLAGALDERAAIVCPNESGAGACGCYRVHMNAVTEHGENKPSERLSDILNNFSYWFGPDLKEYARKEEELPFDCHFIKAMVAPRTLIVADAASDIWCNPGGSWQTTMAAKEVFKLLGAEENLYWYYRRGYHYHKAEDARRLVSVIEHKWKGTPVEDTFFVTPFKQPELIFDWKCPEKK